jgi:hypothetical protein
MKMKKTNKIKDPIKIYRIQAITAIFLILSMIASAQTTTDAYQSDFYVTTAAQPAIIDPAAATLTTTEPTILPIPTTQLIKPATIDYSILQLRPITTASTTTTIEQPVKELDLYEIPPEDLDYAVGNIATERQEPTDTTRDRVTTRIEEGELSKEADEFQEVSPLKYRSAMYYLQDTDPEMYQKLQYAKDITPDTLERTVQITDQTIAFSDILQKDTQTAGVKSAVRLQSIDGQMYALVPKATLADRQVILQMRDSESAPIADIIIKYGDKTQAITGGEKRAVESMRLVTYPKETMIRTLSNQFLKIKVKIDADLLNINDETALDLNTQTSIDQGINAQFRKVAESQRLALIDRAGVFTVKKTQLTNKEDIDNVKVIFYIQKEWRANDKKDHVKIMRYDETNRQVQILPTQHIEEEEGYDIYSAYSPEGLSTFAVFMVDTIESASPEEFKTAQLKKFGLPLLLLVMVGGIFVGTFFSRMRQKPDKKKKEA